jgi:tRNA(Ile)-lysidine synthase
MRIPFLSQVRKIIERHGMLAVGDRVLVAVSGGPDSVALLRVLLELRREYGLRLFLAHLDHGLREGSREEARFVKGMAKALKMACYSQRADIIGFCRRKKLSLEEGAREVRYAFLEEAARKARASRIALGHTMDDQAETVMMRLIRGAGPRGLAGIPPVRGKIIRPLIGTRRNDIIRFLDQNRLPYLLDPSNRDPKFLRNRIRLLLIPLLEREFNPGIVRALARTGQLFTKEGVKETRGQHGWEGDLRIRGVGKTTKLVLDLSKFLEYNKRLQREAVREAVKRIRGDLRGIGFIHTESILALAEGRVGGEVELPGGFRARRGYREIVMERGLPPVQPKPFNLSVKVPGVTKLPQGTLRTSLLPASVAPKVWPKGDGRTAWFDVLRLRFPLRVRTRREGDRFWALGLARPKRLKEILINDKVPREKRNELPLLVDREGILWVLGGRVSERAKVCSKTRRMLKAEFIRR